MTCSSPKYCLMKHLKLNFFISLIISYFSLTTAFAQKILVKTERGNIVLQLFPDKAPVTCKNFLRYVNEHRYDGAIFYRVVRLNNQPDKKVKIEVIQGGLGDDSIKTLPRIEHETTAITGVRHLDGTLSMARNGPGTAGSEFFICINDQPELDYGGKRNPDGQGFAAFGKVLSGMSIVKQIQKEETGEGEKSQTLVKPVKIIRMSVLK
jgi:peptidyl-prolyl cis-trans isomerase A (cyclophilin A)